MAQLADYLSTPVNPVVDKTGLTGKYDFSMQYARTTGGAQSADTPADSAPDLLTAIQEQLGLKLNSTKGPLDFLVIDDVVRTPTEN
jgi:uncharacterized protein (TIGR03435 family)